jgi:LmeA-like phospholipid-binding
MIRSLVQVVVVVLVLTIVPEVAAHFFFQSQVAAAVAKDDPNAQDVSASLPIPMLPTLLTRSSLSRVTVSAHQVNLSSLTAAKVVAVARGVHVNLPYSLVNKRVQITHVDRIDLTLTITQDEASALLPAGYRFVFGKDTVTLQGTTTSITGRFRLEPPSRIVFSVVGSSVPVLTLLPAISFRVRPLANCVQSATLTPGNLTVTCEETNPSVDLLPHR